MLAAMFVLVSASFATLGLRLGDLFTIDAAQRMGGFLAELLLPALEPRFLAGVVHASLETLSMSALGTLLAALGGLGLGLAAARTHEADPARARIPARLLLNALRAIPELVWATLLIVSAGLGPFAGTLALALHTTGVLGRLFAEAIENAPPGPAFSLRVQGTPAGLIFLYATLPQILPHLLSYSLYRWENNIRAAAVLGVVGGGGLGALLSFHMGLFHMRETATILAATLVLVACVDLASWIVRTRLQQV